MSDCCRPRLVHLLCCCCHPAKRGHLPEWAVGALVAVGLLLFSRGRQIEFEVLAEASRLEAALLRVAELALVALGTLAALTLVLAGAVVLFHLNRWLLRHLRGKPAGRAPDGQAEARFQSAPALPAEPALIDVRPVATLEATGPRSGRR